MEPIDGPLSEVASSDLDSEDIVDGNSNGHSILQVPVDASKVFGGLPPCPCALCIARSIVAAVIREDFASGRPWVPAPHRVGVKGTCMGYAQRNASKHPAERAGKVFPGQVDAKKYPALCEYLALTKWEDGKPRETSTLLIFVGDGGLVGGLNDRANGQTLWVTEDSIQGLLDGIEEHLREGTGVWRRNVQQGRGGAKK